MKAKVVRWRRYRAWFIPSPRRAPLCHSCIIVTSFKYDRLTAVVYLHIDLSVSSQSNGSAPAPHRELTVGDEWGGGGGHRKQWVTRPQFPRLAPRSAWAGWQWGGATTRGRQLPAERYEHQHDWALSTLAFVFYLVLLWCISLTCISKPVNWVKWLKRVSEGNTFVSIRGTEEEQWLPTGAMWRDGGMAEEGQGREGVPQLSLPGGQSPGGATAGGEPGPTRKVQPQRRPQQDEPHRNRKSGSRLRGEEQWPPRLSRGTRQTTCAHARHLHLVI